MRRGKLRRPERLCPSVTGSPEAAAAASPMRRSCSGLRGENLPTQATAATPRAGQAAASRASASVESGVTSTPRWSRPPGTMHTWRPRAKCAGSSPGPADSASPTVSARSCTRALTASVVPRVARSTRASRAGPSSPAAAAARPRAARTARTVPGRSSCRVGTLAEASSLAAGKAAPCSGNASSAASVCVPPASIPRTICPFMTFPASSRARIQW